MFEFLTRAREKPRGPAGRQLTAREIMSSPVVTVEPSTPVRKIAAIFAEKGISAVPVVDSFGAPVGMVSDGDLIGRAERDRMARRSWWLGLIYNEKLLKETSPEEAETIRERTAQEIMSTPVITMSPNNSVSEAAHLFSSYKIKRAPVVEDGRLIGMVSRADLVRALLMEMEPIEETEPERLSAEEKKNAATLKEAGESQVAEIHRRFEGVDTTPTVDDFRNLVKRFEQLSDQRRATERKAAAERRRAAVKELTGHHLADDVWQSTLQRAREAAACGARELLLLRFPHDLCSDGGRAINAPEPDWPSSLRGEAAEVYLRWQRELKPQGFQLAARVLDFPGGLIGDIGLFLVWGK
jgi:CBS domain-containing protein